MKNELFIQKNLFFLSLISSIFICLSSNSFLMMWMSMEINLFSMIPLISMNQKFFNEKSTMIYFLIQGISSSIILLSISLNLEKLKSMLFMMTFLSIFMKLGMFPFHFWMISTIEGMSWKLSFILMTLQKIIPIFFLMSLIQQNMIIMFCLMNSFIAAISGITMFSMRKIMAFSSINHLSIMLMSMILSKSVFKMYFVIYSFMTFSATKMMQIFNLNFLFQTMTNLKFNKMNTLIMMMVFLSMAGIPPFLGFMPKMITILAMMKSEMFLSVSIMLILNTLSTYFYLRITMNNILMNFNMKKMKMKMKNVKSPLYLIFSPIYMILLWNFKLKKLLIFKIKIKKN